MPIRRGIQTTVISAVLFGVSISLARLKKDVHNPALSNVSASWVSGWNCNL